MLSINRFLKLQLDFQGGEGEISKNCWFDILKFGKSGFSFKPGFSKISQVIFHSLKNFFVVNAQF